MSNSDKIFINKSNSEIHEEEKEFSTFNSIESTKMNDREFIPEYNIKKDRYESLNISIFENINNQNQNFNNNKNNEQYLDEFINQSRVSFQDVPLNQNHNEFNQIINNDNFSNPLKIQIKYLNSNIIKKSTDPYLEIEEAGEKNEL